jgi:hypothetical protein
MRQQLQSCRFAWLQGCRSRVSRLQQRPG